ncbi:FadR/GntR family transcriptional regulator [Sphingomonas sp. RS2018]
MPGLKRAGSAHVEIARQLGTEIVTGQRAPGTLLPGEIDLADTIGVSRSVVREALRMLVAKGMIQSRPKAGTRVRPRSEWNLLDPTLLGWMFSGSPPSGFVRSLFQLRMIVEPAAAEIAARTRTDDQLDRIRVALEGMTEHGLDTPEGQSADQTFHAVLLEATDNELLVTLSAGIAAAVRWTTFFKYRMMTTPRDPIPQHRLLYEAIAASDPDGAREATAQLIRQAQLDTEKALGE